MLKNIHFSSNTNQPPLPEILQTTDLKIYKYNKHSKVTLKIQQSSNPRRYEILDFSHNLSPDVSPPSTSLLLSIAPLLCLYHLLLLLLQSCSLERQKAAGETAAPQKNQYVQLMHCIAGQIDRKRDRHAHTNTHTRGPVGPVPLCKHITKANNII